RFRAAPRGRGLYSGEFERGQVLPPRLLIGIKDQGALAGLARTQAAFTNLSVNLVFTDVIARGNFVDGECAPLDLCFAMMLAPSALSAAHVGMLLVWDAADENRCNNQPAANARMIGIAVEMSLALAPTARPN